MDEVEFSIVVPCRGHAKELEFCLSSLVTQNTSVKYEILVVYCNQDMDVDAVVKKNPMVQSVLSDVFLLPGEARNTGARRAKADIIGFIDADCVVDLNWITFAFQTMQSGAVLCSGAILDFVPWNMISSTDNRLQYADFPSGRPYGSAKYFSGANLAVRKDIFHLVNGFPGYSNAQDVIFTMKIAELWPEKTIFNPKMVVRHFGRSKWAEFLEHQRYFGFSRAENSIQVKGVMAWISRHPWLGWLLFFRRFIYISIRVCQWNSLDLPRYLMQFPFLIPGLVFWVKGFYEGISEKNLEIKR